jgi:spoIIIJ-associated protein
VTFEKNKERLEAMAGDMRSGQINRAAAYIRSLSSLKTVHEFVTANYPDLTTNSVGEGREKQLVIS